MKVLIFGPSGQEEPGGVASTVRELSLSQLGSSTLLLHSTMVGGRPSLLAFLKGFQIILVERLRAIRSGEHLILHLNMGRNGSTIRKVAYCYFSYLLKLRYVILIHGGGYREFFENLPRVHQRVVANALSHANGLAAVASDTVDFLKNFSSISCERISYLPNGTGAQPGSGAPTVDVALQTTTTAVFIGPATHAKGIDLYVELAKQFNTEKIQFLAIGSKPESDDHDMGPVDFAGPLSHDQTLVRMSSASCLILTSRVEAMPMVVLEAMSLGVPVIAARVGDVPAVLGEGDFGSIFETGSYEELSDIFENFVLDPKPYLIKAERAKLIWAQNFSRDAMRERLEHFWEISHG